jgi:hypothetical protein
MDKAHKPGNPNSRKTFFASWTFTNYTHLKQIILNLYFSSLFTFQQDINTNAIQLVLSYTSQLILVASMQRYKGK